jgi:hypothetical protein
MDAARSGVMQPRGEMCDDVSAVHLQCTLPFSPKAEVFAVTVVEAWTGKHASALKTALRLTNESFAQTLGTATRTVAKWSAEPDVVPIAEMQRALDTLLERSPDDAHARFASLVDGPHRLEGPADTSATELRLAYDAALSQLLTWVDEHAGWPIGRTRQLVAADTSATDLRQLQDRAHRRAQINRSAIAQALSQYYGPDFNAHQTYAARCSGDRVLTSILTSSNWLDLALPLGTGRDDLEMSWGEQAREPALNEACATAAVKRIAEVLATSTRIVNAPLYRLTNLSASTAGIRGRFALADFASYALTMDLLENELIDTLTRSHAVKPGTLPLRDHYLPSINSVLTFDQRLCAGGPVALFAAARQPRRRNGRRDYVLLVQERSGRVLNAARKLAVIPKAFHQPLVDFSDDAHLSATIEREMEEELFGRVDLESIDGDQRQADPLHMTRLSPPMRWLMDHSTDTPPSWRMECTGFGLNLVSGNFEFASLVVVEDESWWTEHGGAIEANWESDRLHCYSTLDREGIRHLVRDPTWSNEGLFAFLQGLRRLSEIGEDRVDLPRIDLETDRG